MPGYSGREDAYLFTQHLREWRNEKEGETCLSRFIASFFNVGTRKKAFLFSVSFYNFSNQKWLHNKSNRIQEVYNIVYNKSNRIHLTFFFSLSESLWVKNRLYYVIYFQGFRLGISGILWKISFSWRLSYTINYLHHLCPPHLSFLSFYLEPTIESLYLSSPSACIHSPLLDQ